MLDNYDAMRPFLEATFIPMEHLLHQFLQKTDGLFLKKVVWLFSGGTAMTELGPKPYESRKWKDPKPQEGSALPMKFSIDRRAELFQKGCTVSVGFCRPKVLPEPIRKAAGMSEEFPGMEMSALWEFVSSIFPGNATLEEEWNRMLWNEIFNSTIPILTRRTGTSASLGIR